jgi:ATP-dependent phosphoenolpyruvate carboxykinase
MLKTCHLPALMTLKIFFDIEKTKTKCDWRQNNEGISDEEFDIHFKAAEEYIRNLFVDVFEFKQMQYKS